MSDRNGTPIHPDGPLAAPQRAPARPPAMCPALCGEPEHSPRRCVDPEILRLRRRVSELEAELRAVRSEIAAAVASHGAPR